MTRIESLVIRALLWSAAGTAAAIPTLVLPGVADPLVPAVVHLSLACVFAIGLTLHVGPLAEPPWFEELAIPAGARRALTGIAVAAAAVAALVPGLLATGVALRYAPSMQFFVIGAGLVAASMSAIATVGLRFRLAGGAALLGGLALGAVAVVAAGRYLATVGTGVDGALVASGSDFGRLVVPWWAGAALLATIVFTLGAGRD